MNMSQEKKTSWHGGTTWTCPIRTHIFCFKTFPYIVLFRTQPCCKPYGRNSLRLWPLVNHGGVLASSSHPNYIYIYFFFYLHWVSRFTGNGRPGTSMHVFWLWRWSQLENLTKPAALVQRPSGRWGLFLDPSPHKRTRVAPLTGHGVPTTKFTSNLNSTLNLSLLDDMAKICFFSHFWQNCIILQYFVFLNNQIPNYVVWVVHDLSPFNDFVAIPSQCWFYTQPN